MELELPGFKRSGFKEAPRSNSKTNSIVQLHSWLWLSFLHRTGFHNDLFKGELVEKNIDYLRNEFVKYQTKYKAEFRREDYKQKEEWVDSINSDSARRSINDFENSEELELVVEWT